MSQQDVVCVSLQLGIFQHTTASLTLKSVVVRNCDLRMGEGREIQLWGMPAHTLSERRAGVWEVN